MKNWFKKLPFTLARIGKENRCLKYPLLILVSIMVAICELFETVKTLANPKMRRRIMALVLACCMMLTLNPLTELAAESASGVPSECTHHTEHTQECGYTQVLVGMPCSHEQENGVHTENCYQEQTSCTHEHKAECYPTSSSASSSTATSLSIELDKPVQCTHVCNEEIGCITKVLNCLHTIGTHDDTCGYAAGAEGTVCGFVCDACKQAAEEPTQSECECPSVDSGEIVHIEGCLLYEKPAVPEQTQAVINVLALINALPTMDELAAQDNAGEGFEAYLTKLRLDTAAARSAYDALTDEEKTAFDAAVLAKLTELEGVLAVMPVLMSDAIPTLGENVSGQYYYQNVTYSLTEGTPNGTATVNGVLKPTAITGVDNVLTIPAQVKRDNGTIYDVTAISAVAFKSNKQIVAVTIPSSITTIVAETFSSCTSLGTVTIPNSVTTIGKKAFDGIKTGGVVTLEHTQLVGNGINSDSFLTTSNSPYYIKASSSVAETIGETYATDTIHKTYGIFVSDVPVAPFNNSKESLKLTYAKKNAVSAAAGGYEVLGAKAETEFNTTTYGTGYVTYLSTNASPALANSKRVSLPGEGAETYAQSGIWVKAESMFISNGQYLRITYTLRNNTNAPIDNVSMGVAADTMIGLDDRASIFPTPTGFRLVNNYAENYSKPANADSAQDMQFTLNCKNAFGADNVDTMWYGLYSNGDANIFTDLADKTELTRTDSGLAFSWKNMEIPANDAITRSVVFGVGDAAPPPALPTNPDSKPIALYLTTSGQNSITVNAKVTDTTGVTDTLYYTINDGAEQQLGETVTADGTEKTIAGVIGADNFTADNTYTVKLWIMNSKGAMSEVITKVLTVSSGAMGGAGLETGTAPVPPGGGGTPPAASCTCVAPAMYEFWKDTINANSTFPCTEYAFPATGEVLGGSCEVGGHTTTRVAYTYSFVSASSGNTATVATKDDETTLTFPAADTYTMKCVASANGKETLANKTFTLNAAAPKITVKINDVATEHGGATLQEAVDIAKGDSAYSIITKLTITKGEVMTTDWIWFAGNNTPVLNNLTDFTVENTVATVAAIPDLTQARTFPMSIVTVSIPQAITIGSRAFNNCAELTTASFPAAESIGSGAFYSCEKLATLKLGETVPTVGSDAFYSCPSTRSLKFVGTDGTTELTGVALTNAQTKYDAVTADGGISTDDFWYGWKVRNAVATPKISIKVNETATEYGGDTLQAAVATAGGTSAVTKLTITAGEVTTTDWTWLKNLTKMTDFTVDSAVTSVANIPESTEYNPVFPELIANVTIPKVASIGNFAFSRRVALVTANFPNATIIGESMFAECTELTTVNFPKALTIGKNAFKNCKKLTTANFPAATSIGASAFSSCIALTSADFPMALSTGEHTFYLCTSLKTASFSVATSIGAFAFYGCTKLETANIRAAESIGRSAFVSCNALTTATFLLVTSIESSAFGSCNTLTTATFPVATSIGAYAFSSCSKLATLKLGADVPTTVETTAFTSCPTIRELKLVDEYGNELTDTILINAQAKYDKVVAPDTGTNIDGFWYGWKVREPVAAPKITIKIGDGEEVGGATLQSAIGSTTLSTVTKLTITKGEVTAADWTWFAGNGTPVLTKLTDFTIDASIADGKIADIPSAVSDKSIFPKTIENVSIPQAIDIGQRTFFDCFKLKMASFPKATSIGNYTFYGTILEEAKFPKVTSVGTSAFSGCNKLTTAYFPVVTEIKEYAFSGCTLLATLKLGATPPAVTNLNAFTNCPKTYYLTLVDESGTALQGDTLTKAQAKYDEVIQGGTSSGTYHDGLWYGWKVREPIAAKITISVTTFGSNNIYNIAGADLQAAVTRALSEDRIKLESVLKLEIAAGEMTNTDWLWLKSLTKLKEFVIKNEVTKVEDIPAAADNEKIFPNLIELVSIPQAIAIGDNALYKCEQLYYANFPEATSIGQKSFAYCSLLRSIDFSKVTSIGKVAFAGCTRLATAKFPEATSIGDSAFNGCTILATTQFPKAESIGWSSFASCAALTDISFPMATSIDDGSFSSCPELTTAAFPKATSIGVSAFNGCAKLATLKLGVAVPTTVGATAFNKCPDIRVLKLVDVDGIDLIGDILSTAQESYDKVVVPDTGTNTDGLWYGWKVREAVPAECTCTLNAPTFAGSNVVIAADKESTTHPLQAFGSALSGSCEVVAHSSTAVTYSFAKKTDASNIASITGTTLTVTGAGSVVITATATANGISTTTDATFTVTKAVAEPEAEWTPKGGFTTSGTFSAALMGINANGGKITLLKDIISTAQIQLPAKAVTIDLNDKTWSVQNGINLAVAESHLTVQDTSTNAQGKITTTSRNNATISLVSGAHFTLKSGIVESTKGFNVISSLLTGKTVGGAITITGGTVSNSQTGTLENYNAIASGSGFIMTGGTVTSETDAIPVVIGKGVGAISGGAITNTGGVSAVLVNTGATAQISGGTLSASGANNNCYAVKNYGTLKLSDSSVLSGGEATLYTQDGASIVANINDSYYSGSNVSVYYKSDNQSDGDVLVSGLKDATQAAKFTLANTSSTLVSAYDASAKAIKLSKIAVTGVTLNKTTLALDTGENETLTATITPANATNKAVTWKTSDASIATVDANGKVTAIAVGSATITVTTTDGGKTATCAVTVTEPTIAVTGVSLNKTTLALDTNKSEALTATITPANSMNKAVTWKTSDASIATVDANGKVTAIAVGSATITVTTTDGGKTATCAVTVTTAIIKPAPGGKLEAPLTQDKIDGVFGEGNATLDTTTTPSTIIINKDITPENSIEIIVTPIKIDMGGNTIKGEAGETPIIVGDNVTVDIGGSGTIAGGDSTTGTGGNGITGGTDSNITIGKDVIVSGGNGTTGGDGINSKGNVTVDGDIQGGNGNSGASGNNGGDGVDTSTGAGDITINNDGTATGGNGGNGSDKVGGNGGNGTNSGTGSTTVPGEATGGNGGNGTTDGGIGGSGSSSTGGGSITVDGEATGGTGGNASSGIGGNGGDGSETAGNIEINNGGTSTGGAGGDGAQSGGIGGSGSNSGTVTVDNGGTATGGNGGTGGTGAGGEGGNGTTSTGKSDIDGTATGGNGGNGTTDGGIGGSGSSSTGGGSITVDGEATGGTGGNASSGIGGNGGDGSETAGNIEINNGGTSTGGAGGDGAQSGGIGGSGSNSGTVTVDNGGTATGGNGGTGGTGAGGEGGNGTTSTGKSDIDGEATGGNGGSGSATGGNGGDGAASGTGSDAGDITVGETGDAAGGNGGTATGGSGTGGNGGNGTSTDGKTEINNGGTSTGGAGGNGAITGGAGGNGADTSTGGIIVDGDTTGGNGGAGTEIGNGNGNGGNGGNGANQDSGIVNGGGNATGGNGGTGVGTGEGGNGGEGVGGGATADGSLDVTAGAKGRKATAEVDDSKADTTVTVPDKSTLTDAALSEEEKTDSAISEVNVVLNVEKKNNQPDKAEIEKAIISEAADTIGAFFDITLDKIITNASGAQPSVSVKQASKEIEITIEIPTDMREGSNYIVIRVHNGVAQALTTTQSGNNLTFKTDKFSTYAIAYTKADDIIPPTPTPTPIPSPSPIPPSPTPPSEGEDGGDKGSVDYENEFWIGIVSKIQGAKKGDVIKISTGSYDKMPASVMEELRLNGTGLVVTWNGGKTITIPQGKAKNAEEGRIYWPLSYLAELYKSTSLVKDTSKTNPSTGVFGYYDSETGETIPVTGSIVEVPSAKNSNGTDVKITPPSAGFEQSKSTNASKAIPIGASVVILLAAVLLCSAQYQKKKKLTK